MRISSVCVNSTLHTHRTAHTQMQNCGNCSANRNRSAGGGHSKTSTRASLLATPVLCPCLLHWTSASLSLFHILLSSLVSSWKPLSPILLSSPLSCRSRPRSPPLFNHESRPYSPYSLLSFCDKDIHTRAQKEVLCCAMKTFLCALVCLWCPSLLGLWKCSCETGHCVPGRRVSIHGVRENQGARLDVREQHKQQARGLACDE